MFLWLKTLYRKRAVTWPFIFYTIIWTLSFFHLSRLFSCSIYLYLYYNEIKKKFFSKNSLKKTSRSNIKK
ncbi:hypothetical protein FS851_14930 [Enterococcus durans]|nr:hypothetical protein FS851_14930 [Enterococcus durans]